MRMRWWLCALALSGCSHQFDTKPVPVTAPPTFDTVGHTHAPYTGRPRYLAAARPLHATTIAPTQGQQPCQTRSPSCDDRLRATLAAIDGHLLALQTPPTEVELQAMRLSLIELTPLLTPYPDIAAERDELGQLVEQLPTMTPDQQAKARRRMSELTDLIRVQLAAAQ